MNTTDMFVIKTEGLSKTYNGIIALQDLNLQIPRHSVFGFLGPNGAGKRTSVRVRSALCAISQTISRPFR